MKKKAYFLFSFYGSGNIGDDLMVAGYLELLGQKYQIDAFTKFNMDSQKLRFPEINWISRIPKDFSIYDIIIGMGDTPFQISDGKRLIKNIYKNIKKINKANIPIEMQFIGAEKEILNTNNSFKKKIRHILNSITKIYVRDAHSKAILKAFNVNTEIIVTGDIANIYLSRFNINQPKNNSKEIAINYFGSKRNDPIIRLLKKFIAKNRGINFTFFANETRQKHPFEYYIYKKHFAKFKNVSFFSPDYNTLHLNELINHFNNYDIVLSSRYHALLTASWFRKRVIALTLTSKISNLAQDLGINLIHNDLDYGSFLKIIKEVEIVGFDKLLGMEDKIIRVSKSF